MMKAVSRLSFVCLLFCTHLSWTYLSSASDSQAANDAPGSARTPLEQGKVLRRSYFFQEAGQRMDYALYVPTGYRPERPAPLVILLHGLGSNPFQIIHYRGIVEQAEKRGYIVAAPVGYNAAGWYGSQGAGRDFRISWLMPRNSPTNLGELSEKDVLHVLAEVRGQFRIDSERTYLMGHSMGGAGTLYLGAKHPSNWAALAALAPARVENDAPLKNLRRVPVMVVQGDADLLVKVENTRRIISDLEQAGVPHQYEEIKGGDHLFSIAVNPQMIARVFDFFDAHHR